MRKLLVFLLVLGVLAAVGDRLAHKLATDEAEKRLAAEGLASPTVDVRSFPFLTQLLSRSFADVRLTTPSVHVGDDRAVDVTATGHDVQVPSLGRTTVGQLTAQGTVTYAEVLRQIGGSGLRLSSAGSGQIQLRREVSVLGRTYAVVARGRVEPRGTRLRVTPTSFQLAGGGAVDDRLAQVLTDRFTINYRLGDLPEGVRIDKIVPVGNGLVVDVSGRDVRLSSVSAAAHALLEATG